jgi:outer membrane receptor protein involved in Fe transport
MPASLIAASSFAAAQASRSNIGIFTTRKTIDIPPVRRYCSGQKKRWFKIPIQITNYANIVPSHYNVDLAVSYDMGDQPENEYLRNISLQLVVNNVTNKKLKAEF